MESAVTLMLGHWLYGSGVIAKMQLLSWVKGQVKRLTGLSLTTVLL